MIYALTELCVNISIGHAQWCNRWGGGGRVPPETSDQEISADLLGKKWEGKKEKGWEIKKEKENCKREGRKLKMKMEGGKS